MGKIYTMGTDYKYIKRTLDPDATSFAAPEKGDVELIGNVLGCAIKDFIVKDDVDALVYMTEGPAKGTKAQGTGEAMTAGDKLYWDSAAELVTETAGGNRLIGYCESDASDDDEFVFFNFDGFKATTS